MILSLMKLVKLLQSGIVAKIYSLWLSAGRVSVAVSYLPSDKHTGTPPLVFPFKIVTLIPLSFNGNHYNMFQTIWLELEVHTPQSEAVEVQIEACN